MNKKQGMKKYIKKELGTVLIEKDIVIDGVTTTYKIRSDGTVISTVYQGHKRKVPYEMKGGCDSDGYHIVTLTIDGKKSTKKIHRLVATAFIPNPDNKPEVNHIDGNKFNNNVENLEWVTTKENTQHAELSGLRHNKKMRKIINNICKMLESDKYSIKEICDELNIERWLVKSVIKKKIWKDISDKYQISNYNPLNHDEKIYTVRKTSIDESMCKKICADIESNKISLIDISKKYKVEKYDVLKIYHGKLYPEISSLYDFTKYTKRTSKYFKGGDNK